MPKRIIAILLILIAAAAVFIVPNAMKTNSKNEGSSNLSSDETSEISSIDDSPISIASSEDISDADDTSNDDKSTDDTSNDNTSSDNTSNDDTSGDNTSNDDTSNDDTSGDGTSNDVSSNSQDQTSDVDSSTADTPIAGGGSQSVSANGILSVDGKNIVNQNGEAYTIRGVSTHGISWFPAFVNESAFKSLRDDWGINTIRLACYSQSGIYRGQTDIDLVKKGIDACIALDMYVIVDWHILGDGNPQTEKSNAKEFFKQIIKEYADCPNVIYELCNEPNGNVTWKNDIKPYCEELIPIIRDKCDNIIICGTGTWSQDVHDVVGNEISGENIAYAVHFYADTHKQWLRDRVTNARNSGICVMVTEFGTCDASGGGAVNESETNKWLEYLESNGIAYVNWALSDKQETCAILKPGSSATGGWKESNLTTSGSLFLNWVKNINE